MLTEQIREKAERYGEEITQFRRELHCHPELSIEEYETSHKIVEKLYSLEGMGAVTGAVGGIGVVGILTGAKGTGKTVLLCADIDVLSIEEKTELPFSLETSGMVRACGYDKHTAQPLGSVMILSKLCNQFSGHVKFVSQPGEENRIGGRKMVGKDRVPENPAVDAVFAAYVWSETAAGETCVAERRAFGYPGRFEIQMTGQDGHGSWLHEYIDPITTMNQTYSGLQQIVSRRLPETATRVSLACTIRSGPQDKRNTILDCCITAGTLRSGKLEVTEQMEEEIQ